MEWWSGSAEDTNQHLAITPKALHSKAQRRAAHAGFWTTPMTEPQRGSTKGASFAFLCALCEIPLSPFDHDQDHD